MEKFENLTPDQIVGLTDAEGTFFAASYESKTGNSFNPTIEFKISQMGYSKELLVQLEKTFDCGEVADDNKENGSLKFTVRDPKVIKEKIIPFFDKHPLVTSKQLDYLNFRRIVLLLTENKIDGVGISRELHEEIENIRSDSNTSRPAEQIYQHCEKISIDQISEGWLAGFIEGDGSFQSTISKETAKNFAFTPSLEITQKGISRPLLNLFKKRFNGGSVKPKLDEESFKGVINHVGRTVHRYDLRGIDIIINNVLPILDKYTLFTIKGKDYEDWKKLINMYKGGAHKTLEGRNAMRKIKAGMNEGRPERK